MRTTIDLDEDILRTAKNLAQEKSQSLGQVISDLARRGLQGSRKTTTVRNGVPLLPRLPGAKPVTSKDVEELLEKED